jgi:hypothetical protein
MSDSFFKNFTNYRPLKTCQKIINTMNYTERERAKIDELRKKLQGNILLPNDDEFLKAKEIWNGSVKYQPALIVLPETVEDVQAAVIYARENNTAISVLGGGHDWAGRALNQDGMVISLRRLKNIKIDQTGMTAIVEGGITAAELIAAIDSFDMVAVTGTIGAVGFAGLTLGGGYGPLSPTYGLAIDNLLGAEIVLANGDVITANAQNNPDIFWAIKGGGGNFGIVTSMKIQLHAAKPILAGLILYPWSEATNILKRYSDLMQTAPDELAMLAGVIPATDGSPVLFLAPTWYGDLQTGEQIIASVQKMGTPIMSQIAPMRYKDLLALFDAHVVNGRHCAIQTRWLPQISDHAVSEIVNAATKRTSVLSMINIHHFHGASTRVDLSDTAFGIRTPHFMLEIIAVWEPEEEANAHSHKQWARDLSNSIIEDALPGGYANLLGPDEVKQIRHAHGQNLERLQQIKRLTDAENVFKGIPIHF